MRPQTTIVSPTHMRIWPTHMIFSPKQMKFSPTHMGFLPTLMKFPPRHMKILSLDWNFLDFFTEVSSKLISSDLSET